MNKKKVLLTVLALILVCALSVTGTLAYLQASQEGEQAVVNTFVAAGGGKIITSDDALKLVESKAEYTTAAEATADKPMGYHLIRDTETTKNNYKMATPNMTIPKDPKLTVNLEAGIEAYIFVKVIDATQGNIIHTVDTTKWGSVTVSSITSPDALYVYKTATSNIVTGVSGSDLENVAILAGNNVTVLNAGENDAAFTDTVPDDVNKPETLGVQLGELKFEAYVCQAAGFADAAAAFNACFVTTTP